MTWRSADRLTLPQVLDDQAAKLADKVCMFFEDDPVTYAQMSERSVGAANALHELGVAAGDTVALLCENSPEMVYTWFGAARLGAVEVAINSAYRGEFLRHQLANARARVVVADAHLAGHVLEVADQLPDLETLMVRPGEEPLPDPAGRLRVVTTDLFSEVEHGALRTSHTARWDDPCSIIYTGGTTGPSKGAVLSHNYMVMAARQFSDAWRSGPDDIVYSPLPLFHLNAKAVTVLGSFVAGQTGVLDKRFSVRNTWDRVRQYGATGITLLGSMMIMLWNLPRHDDDADLPIRSMLAAPIPPELHHAIEERYGLRIVALYGLSEAAPLAISSVDDPPIPGSAGRLNPLFDVRLFDDEEREVPVGNVGEVVCRPQQPHVMFEGYHNAPDATLAAFKNLWFHTGDLGRVDEDGYFYFVDRKKDAMRRRGENISSFEVERAVQSHPAVAEVAAHGVPSEFGEDDVKVCVILLPGAALTPEELAGHCVQNMPYFAVPRYIEFVDDLPRSPVGRVLKYELRARGVTPHTWDREVAGFDVPRPGRTEASA